MWESSAERHDIIQWSRWWTGIWVYQFKQPSGSRFGRWIMNFIWTLVHDSVYLWVWVVALRKLGNHSIECFLFHVKGISIVNFWFALVILFYLNRCILNIFNIWCLHVWCGHMHAITFMPSQRTLLSQFPPYLHLGSRLNSGHHAYLGNALPRWSMLLAPPIILEPFTWEIEAGKKSTILKPTCSI